MFCVWFNTLFSLWLDCKLVAVTPVELLCWRLQPGCLLMPVPCFGPQTEGWKHVPHLFVQSTANGCAHTQTRRGLCGSHAALVMAMGHSSFNMEPVDATGWQLSNSVKVKGFAMSGILKHFSERGLWVWTCEICWARGCSSLCPCADSPGAPGAHIQGLCPRKAFPANCLLTTGRLREACFISYLLTLQDSKENTKGARRQSRVHSILKILLP